MSNEPYGWREGMATGGILMEVPSGRIVTSGLSMPHSPRVIDGNLYVLEGGRGQLLLIDPVAGAQQVLATLPGFTHGFAAYRGRDVHRACRNSGTSAGRKACPSRRKATS